MARSQRTPAVMAALGAIAVTAVLAVSAAASPVPLARHTFKPICGHHHCHTTSPPPSTSPPPTTSPPPSTSPPPTMCTAVLNGGACGPFDWAGAPMSNGFDTYVEPQNVGANAGDTAAATVTDPGNWTLAADIGPAGVENVQVYANTQQLANDWCGNGWDAHGHACAGADGDTPLDSLSHFTMSYSEVSPGGTAVYEASPDIWQANYPSDVMFWTDVSNRCNAGAFGPTVLGHMTMGGQGWTVHRYGGPGAEIIFVLDGSGGPGTCAQQKSATVDIKAGIGWLVANGFETGPPVLTQANMGWEICSTPGVPEVFTMTSYSISAG